MDKKIFKASPSLITTLMVMPVLLAGFFAALYIIGGMPMLEANISKTYGALLILLFMEVYFIFFRYTKVVISADELVLRSYGGKSKVYLLKDLDKASVGIRKTHINIIPKKGQIVAVNASSFKASVVQEIIAAINEAV